MVFTDIEGSTRLLEELGVDAYREALAEHRRVVREACSRHHGYEVDYEGDAFFYAFASAQAALSAVSEAMVGLQAGPIRIRVGIHTGDPALDPPKYVGMDVHRAARIMSTAHGGQVVLSPSTISLLEPGTFELTDLGEHRLKDIEGAVSIFQLGDGSFPPLKTISNTNLPRPASSFVGREAERDEILARIGGGARLVTLTGPGGTGKTRLALEAATSLVPEYKAGVFWVGLASLRDPALVTGTIAQSLGAKDGLAEHIAEREMLLLLDNLEQVIDAAPALSALLQSCANLALLVTSRELLRISGEVEYPVPPLAEPEAVSLFCERAQTAPSEEIAALCAHLDSLPLAVELAAARAKALSPRQILDRLSQRLDLLKGGRDADPRQQTLRATIEWSYDLLTLEEQQLFARLSVFAGGCTLEAAEGVCDADLDTLQSLVEKSLLRFTNERYWMLETIREYAIERRGVADERELMTRHAKVIAAWADRAREGLKGTEEASWLREFADEQSNVRSVLSHLDRVDDVVLLLELVWAIGNYWEIRGEWREGRHWAEVAIARSASQRSLARARVLGFAGMFAAHANDWNLARAHDEEALSITRELGKPADSLFLLPHLSYLAVELGDYVEGTRRLEEAGAIAREIGDRWTLASCDGHMADLALRQGDDGRALEFAESALAYYRERAWSAGIAWCLHLRAVAQFRIGRSSEANASAEEGLMLADSIGDAETRIWLLVLFAALVSRSGQAEVGARLLGAVDASSDRVGLTLTGVEAELRDTTAVLVRDVLDSRYAVAYVDGAALTDDDAVDLALASGLATS